MHKKSPPEAGLSRNTWSAVLFCCSQTVGKQFFGAVTQDLSPAAAEAADFRSIPRRAGLDHRSRTLCSSPIDSTHKHCMTDRIPEFEDQRRFADTVYKHAAAANGVRWYAGDNVEKADVQVQHIRARFIDDFEHRAALKFLPEGTADLFFKQCLGIGVQLELARTRTCPRGASSLPTAVGSVHVAVLDTQAVEPNLGDAGQVDILSSPDRIHDGLVNPGEAIVGHFGVFARLERWR